MMVSCCFSVFSCGDFVLGVFVRLRPPDLSGVMPGKFMMAASVKLVLSSLAFGKFVFAGIMGVTVLCVAVALMMLLVSAFRATFVLGRAAIGAMLTAKTLALDVTIEMVASALSAARCGKTITL
jgi:hypothetical protein